MILFLKRFVFVLLTILLWSCDSVSSKSGAIADFIPENSSIVFKIDNESASDAGFSEFKNSLRNNSILSLLSKTNKFKAISENTLVLENLKPSSSSILCLTELKDNTSSFTFITKMTQGLFETDSLNNKTIETLTIDKKTFSRITIDKETTFTAVKDSVFIASSSQKILMDILDGKTERNPDFLKLYNIKGTNDFSVLLKNEKVQISDSLSVNFASYSSLDVSVMPDGLFATGVALARDTIPQLLSVFEGQIPQQNDIAKLIPIEAKEAFAFTFSDSDSLQARLWKLNGVNRGQTQQLFGTVNEMGEISLESGMAIVLKSMDPVLTLESLAPYISEENEFREVRMSSFSASEMFIESLYPLISQGRPKLMFQLENFFVFSENEAVAKQIITAFKNNNCLDKTTYFEDHQSQLSNASSLLHFKLQGKLPKSLSDLFFTGSQADENSISLKSHPMVALQFSYDRDFAHINLISKEASSEKQISGKVSELFSVTLPNELLGNPQLFTNHRTKDKDVVVQDVTNTLYLIGISGKILWRKKLDAPILGKINEIDLLRNGKKQLAFTTKNTFYVLDRTGKNVAPFPIKFKDPITQPLAVFDYDNKRKYRFVVTQGNEVYMYDSTGKIVKGFTFKKAKTSIVLSPEHIRLGNKDYIAVAEENGKLNLLSRTGKSRITINKIFKFSETQIAKEGSKFVVITADNKKESINTSGKVSTQNLDVSDNYSFSVFGNTKITLDDNLLRINNKLVELPFGIYATPLAFYANNTIYVSITETQEKKLYIYDKNGRLLSGFPVFGTSSAEIGNGAAKGKLLVTVKGGSKEVLLYSKR